MRNPERIKQICLALFNYWNEPGNQDLRLGQLIYNLNYKNTGNDDVLYVDIFNVEDNNWLEWFQNNTYRNSKDIGFGLGIITYEGKGTPTPISEEEWMRLLEG